MEPGSRLFRLRDAKGRLAVHSACLYREATSGDGVCFEEEWARLETRPAVTRVEAWGESGRIRGLTEAQRYLTLLRKRYSGLLGRTHWIVVLSPAILASQEVVWRTLLREAAFRSSELLSNLECLSWQAPMDRSGLFLHWGASGGDLGACLQNETYAYRRLLSGEQTILDGLGSWLEERLEQPIGRDEAERVGRLIGAEGLCVPPGRLVEVRLEGPDSPLRAALDHEELMQAVLGLLAPLVESVLDFVGSLSPQDHCDLFSTGLRLSGGSGLLKLFRDCLRQELEIPVNLAGRPEWAVLESGRLPTGAAPG